MIYIYSFQFELDMTLSEERKSVRIRELQGKKGPVEG